MGIWPRYRQHPYLCIRQVLFSRSLRWLPRIDRTDKIGEDAKCWNAHHKETLICYSPFTRWCDRRFRYGWTNGRKCFVACTRQRPSTSPRMIIGIPGVAAAVERRALMDAAAGARDVYLTGSGAAVVPDYLWQNRHYMIIDINGGRESTVLVSRVRLSWNRYAGDERMNASSYMKKSSFGDWLGLNRWNQIRTGSAYPS